MRKSDSKFAKFLDEKYIPADKKLKIGVAVLLIILPVVLFYFFYFSKKTEQIAGLETKKDQLIKEIQDLREKERRKPELLRQVAEVEDEFEKASQLLPKDQEIPQLLKDISGLGQNVGLEFLTFVPRPEVQKDYYNEIPVDINIRGPYHSVGFFFDQVSKLDRIVSVASVVMGSPERTQGEMLLNSNTQLVTYRFTNVKVTPDEKK